MACLRRVVACERDKHSVGAANLLLTGADICATVGGLGDSGTCGHT